MPAPVRTFSRCPPALSWLPALLGAAILSIAAGLGKPAQAQGLVFTSMVGDRMVIFLLGEVTERSRAEMLPLLRAYRGATVVLEGPGGLLLPGLAIGREIRATGARTLVLDGASCASACGLIWLAGAERDLGDTARIGFHSASEQRGGRPFVSPSGNALVGAYLRELGLGDASIVRLTDEAPQRMAWLTRRELRQLDIELTSMPALPMPSRPSRTRGDAYAALQGIWVGDMACGETVMTVRVLVWRDSTGAVAAAVELGPSVESPMAGHAVFQMRGVAEASGGFRFAGNLRFPNAVPDPPLIIAAPAGQGTVQAHLRAGPACQSFTLRRPAPH